MAANELFTKAKKLRDTSREHWSKANEHLRDMGNDITQMNATFEELAAIIKRIIN